jgi:hypothetical protein
MMLVSSSPGESEIFQYRIRIIDFQFTIPDARIVKRNKHYCPYNISKTYISKIPADQPSMSY